MNKLRKLALIILVAFALVQFSACTKIIDKIFGGDNSPKECRIVSMKQNNIPGGAGSRTLQVYYNNHGDIDSIIADVATGSLGAHLFYFYYNSNHRLIAYREDAGDSYAYQEWHTYAYENGRIVRDSVRVQDGNSTEIRMLDYDNWGRVIKETPKTIADDGVVYEGTPRIFTYDNDGNLMLDSSSYDNGVNFLRTSKHLMFTQRDYSRNNRAGATSYNDRELPLGFVDGIPATYGRSSLLSFGLPAEINYDCE